MKKLLLAIAAVAALCIIAILGILLYIGVKGPETFVVSGQQMNRAHARIVRDLGLLNDSEKIHYFYSDALLDIRQGMYFVTTKRLVLYSDEWEDPKLVTPLAAIIDAEGEFNESFFEDSYITVTLNTGEEWTFPISSEKGKDQAFYDFLISRSSMDSFDGRDLPLEANDVN
ncbi:MAG: hypothetical protein K0U98_20345 [Deltaproteobacteria bacterium]|nr:hypothetical protein [Deltaproteobacteria bacterium]